MDRREFAELTGAAVAGMLVPSPASAQAQETAAPVVRPRDVALGEVKRLASMSQKERAKAAVDVRTRRYVNFLNYFENKKPGAPGNTPPNTRFKVR